MEIQRIPITADTYIKVAIQRAAAPTNSQNVLPPAILDSAKQPIVQAPAHHVIPSRSWFAENEEILLLGSVFIGAILLIVAYEKYQEGRENRNNNSSL